MDFKKEAKGVFVRGNGGIGAVEKWSVFLDEQFSLSAVLGARRIKRTILGPKFSEWRKRNPVKRTC